jgi:hypothetical protein
MKQIYMITYPTGKIYIGKDSVGSYRYFGSPDMALINEEFARLPESVRKDYTIRKQVLWESEDCTEGELSAKEVEFIRRFRSNDPAIGYNRWPKVLNRSALSDSEDLGSTAPRIEHLVHDCSGSAVPTAG